MTPRFTPEEARKIWAELFLKDFLKLPKGREHNAPEKKEFINKVLSYKKDGKVFSDKFLARLMGYADHSAVRYHRKNMGL